METSSGNMSDGKAPDQSSDDSISLPTPDTAFNPVDTRVDDVKDVNSARSGKNLLFAITAGLIRSYKKCNADFRPIETMPQRILTNPPESVSNNGYDNQEANLICRVHDPLVSTDKTYIILDLLGTGTFGQVFRCKREGCKDLFAVKVIKNKPAYHTQGNLEIKIAKLLNQQYDPHNERHIVRLLESFQYKGHICLVFELLSMSLLDLLTQNQFRGLPLSLVQRFTKQILTALMVFEDANVIHCDLKPENILLMPAPQKPLVKTRRIQPDVSDNHSTNNHTSNPANPANPSTEQPADHPSIAKIEKKSASGSDIKVIDLGSACFEGRTIYSYIQSRFCKSEVHIYSYVFFVAVLNVLCICVLLV
ncbi:hypothetical protein EON65_10825 [archaeon]|nr:MAG: hypothetical protein EON65_10825 [archaeon]